MSTVKQFFHQARAMLRAAEPASLSQAQTPPTRSPTSTVARGQQAERVAADYLIEQGLVLIDRNVRAGKGEIDLIMQHGDTVVFVEVRARKTQAYVSAVQSISRSKQLKVIETAERLLVANPAWQHRPCRFDVIGIQLAKGDQPAQLEWIQDAFYAA